MRFTVYLLIVLCGAMCGCSLDSNNDFNLFSLNYDFNTSQTGWSGDFADYKVVDSAACEFAVASASLPSNLAIDQKSIMLSGNNTGKNLFMFLKKKVGGLKPDSDYTLVFEVELASNSPLGVAKGDSVFLKVGACTTEPKVSRQDSYYRLNISKGTANADGKDAVVIGTIGISNGTQDYSLIQKSNSSYSLNPYYLARTNSNGELWLIVGTDSTFKGISTVYFTYVSVVLSASL